jgi:glycosyltransferase involved in cell wall biosynthesis
MNENLADKTFYLNKNKLLILPGISNALGGTLVTLSLLLQGFEQNNLGNAVCVLAPTGSIMQKYLQSVGKGNYLKLISAQSKTEFFRKALQWVNKQPKDYPLLLDNCIERSLIYELLVASPKLRFSRRAIYHFCHDLAISENHLGNFIKKLLCILISPKAICNSQFTATHIRYLMPDIRGIMYQPVNIECFNTQVVSTLPPVLEPILKSGAKLILTPSRISEPGIANDKNLRALIPLLAHLKAQGYFYHSVVIGEDISPNQANTQTLKESAKNAGVSDRFTILPPTFAIADYYKHADVVVSLAPREPFGRTIVEAIASGVPVVGSNTGGIGEILGHFAPQWMVDPNDSVATAEAIINVVNNPNTSQTLAKAKFWVEKNCSVSQYAKRMMEITGCINIDKEKSMESCRINSVN